jgi:hypothetical protein
MCGDGPAHLERSFFLSMRGFNETLSLDCELSARVWLAGRSVMITRMLVTSSKSEAHVAWRAPGIKEADLRRCKMIRSVIYSPHAAAAMLARVRLTNLHQLDCVGARRELQCPAPLECGTPCDICREGGQSSGEPHILEGSLEPFVDAAMNISASFLVQYWAGAGHGQDGRLAIARGALETRHKAVGLVARLTSEVLINDDSWHVTCEPHLGSANRRPAVGLASHPIFGLSPAHSSRARSTPR